MEFQCNRCKKKFNKKTSFHNHKKQQCKIRKCVTCNAVFTKKRDLIRHQKNRKNISCTHCLRTFCSNEHFQQHLRSIKAFDDAVIHDLNQVISPATGFENDEGYLDLVQEKIKGFDKYI